MMESLLIALVPAVIALVTAALGYLTLLIQGNTKGILTMEQRLAKVEKAEERCRAETRQLRLQNLDLELEVKRLRGDLASFTGGVAPPVSPPRPPSGAG